jgi:hypothetical protein
MSIAIILSGGSPRFALSSFIFTAVFSVSLLTTNASMQPRDNVTP